VSEEIIRIISLCVVLASAETLHGIVRATVLVPRIGKKRALKVAIVTGSILGFAVCYLLVPAVGLTDATDLISLGFLLALFMASFDVALAKLGLKLPWAKVLRDFDPRTGNYLILGLLLLVGFPYLAMKMH